MPAADRRRKEMENLKNERIHHIVECAFALFSESGIENISLNEIAIKSEIGIASLYRYFQTKEELAIEVASYAWNIEKELFYKLYASEEYTKLTGFEQLKVLMEVFEEAIITQRNFFSYVYYFDSFINKAKILPDRLKKYESTIMDVNNIVLDALKKGLNDGSINYKASVNNEIAGADLLELYYTMFHSIFCLAQKLSLTGEILNLDKAVDGRRQINLLVNMFLAALK